ncbi:MAG: Mur ligase family protein, partial [Fidelibacterota bacterium]
GFRQDSSAGTHVVVEVSSHALELNRVDDVEFDHAVFTNLFQDHLDFHKTMEKYLTAKTKLFSMLPPGGKAILNADDERFGDVKAVTTAAVVSYSMEGRSTVHFKTWGLSHSGITGTLQAGEEEITVNSPLLGLHNLENILSAVAAAWTLEIPKEAIEQGIEACKTVPGRAERLAAGNGATVVIDYAHTPDAYHKLFSSLKHLLPPRGRLWIIFGCGGDRDRGKRPLMAGAAEEYGDVIFVTPDNPRWESVDEINGDIEAGFRKKTHTFYSNRARAIYDAVNQLDPDDILAIVGKGRENYQIVGGERIFHSDLQAVEKAISGGTAGDAN